MTRKIYDLAGKRVWVAGHRGMVGAALVRRLQAESCEILTAGREVVEFTRQDEVERWMESAKPDVVIVAAAKVGGILANDNYPADFLYENLMIQTNVLEAARRNDVEKLVFLGSSCIYPKLAPQPISEESLLTGPLEPTNQWYAIAKISGIKLAQAYRRQHGCDFISCQPTNLYGPNDNFDLETSHVLPALLCKAHEAARSGAKELVVWGTGKPMREFLHVDDAADAIVFLAEHYSDEGVVNVGTGKDVAIGDLARLICDVTGFQGELVFDTDKPDGTPRKLLDVSRLHALGWRHGYELRRGIEHTYSWYREQLVVETVA